jgi:hypothetical protein
MDNKIIELLSEEIRETKKLIKEMKDMTFETRRIADAAEKKADAAWELVVITRNESQIRLGRLERPWWKRFLGLN